MSDSSAQTQAQNGKLQAECFILVSGVLQSSLVLIDWCKQTGMESIYVLFCRHVTITNTIYSTNNTQIIVLFLSVVENKESLINNVGWKRYESRG